MAKPSKPTKGKPTAKPTKPAKAQPNAEALEAAKLILQQAGYSLTTGKAPTKAEAKATKQATKAVERAARKAAAEKQQKEFAAAVTTTFKAAGYRDLQPKVTIMTLGLWRKQGFQPKNGERPLMVSAPWSPEGSAYAMYHKTQVEPVQQATS